MDDSIYAYLLMNKLDQLQHNIPFSTNVEGGSIVNSVNLTPEQFDTLIQHSKNMQAICSELMNYKDAIRVVLDEGADNFFKTNLMQRVSILEGLLELYRCRLVKHGSVGELIKHETIINKQTIMDSETVMSAVSRFLSSLGRNNNDNPEDDEQDNQQN